MKTIKDWKLKLYNPNGQVKDEVDVGRVYQSPVPSLVIHRSPVNAGFDVSHKDNGKCLAPTFPTRKLAETFVEAIADLTDWSLPPDSYAGNRALQASVEAVAYRLRQEAIEAYREKVAKKAKPE